MELVATKSYHASGIITVTIIFEHTIYVCVLDGSNENPLLDSRFPDISGKGRVYQIKAYTDGIEGYATHSLTHSLTYLLTYLLTHSLTYLLTHSLTHLLTAAFF